MRRFSARNQLVTLHEINITPLLDLAFVLLIIFVITSPLLEQSIDLRLPRGGNARQVTDAKDVMVAEVSPAGVYKLNGRTIADIAAVERELGIAFKANPKLVVRIRADAGARYELPISILEAATRQGIDQCQFATEPVNRRPR